MTVSIIIAVKELNDNLKACLEYCLNLDYPDFEVVVFPDEPFAYQDERVRVIPTGKLTPPKKRDFALKEAKGDILAFIDDDAYPTRDWLKNAIIHFQDDKVGAVCGPAITPLSDSILQQASGLVYASFLVSGGFSYRYIPKPKREVDDYPSCNFLVRRDIFVQLGGFRVNYWPGEDTFLCLEITRTLKKRIVYDPQILVYHHRRPLFIPHLGQVANYALHRGYFVKRFPQTSLRLSYFLPSLFLLFLIFGLPLAYSLSWFKIVYVSVMVIYLLLVLIYSISKELRLLSLRFFGIIFTHLVYGLFFFRGLVSGKLKEDSGK